jgi:hypothetical protein
MAFKKRKDPNGGLSKLAKFEREQALWNDRPERNDIVQSVGAPIDSVDDIKQIFEWHKERQQVEFEEGVLDKMIAEYLKDSSDKQHLVFNCIEVKDGYEWYSMFVSDEQVKEMQPSDEAFSEKYN